MKSTMMHQKTPMKPPTKTCLPPPPQSQTLRRPLLSRQRFLYPPSKEDCAVLPQYLWYLCHGILCRWGMRLCRGSLLHQWLCSPLLISFPTGRGTCQLTSSMPLTSSASTTGSSREYKGASTPNHTAAFLPTTRHYRPSETLFLSIINFSIILQYLSTIRWPLKLSCNIHILIATITLKNTGL